MSTPPGEAHRRQIEEAVDALEEGPEGFYGSSAECREDF